MVARSRARAARGRFPALEWLDEASGALPRVTMAGGRRAMIENHAGILEFDENQVRLLTRQGVMTLRGRDLTLSEVRPDALTVRGQIGSVELPVEDGGDE